MFTPELNQCAYVELDSQFKLVATEMKQAGEREFSGLFHFGGGFMFRT